MRVVVVLLLREAVLVEVESDERRESVMTLCVRVNVDSCRAMARA